MTPEKLGITLDEWKEKFLPTEIGPMMLPEPSRCKMYRVEETADFSAILDGRVTFDNTSETVTCEELIGYEYDRR